MSTPSTSCFRERAPDLAVLIGSMLLRRRGHGGGGPRPPCGGAFPGESLGFVSNALSVPVLFVHRTEQGKLPRKQSHSGLCDEHVPVLRKVTQAHL